MHILLAEDDRRLGTLISHMLKKEHHTVEWVTNGKDAYDYASLTTYDLLILDWMMPELDGIDVCLQLRKESYNGAILMLTARDALDDRVKGLDAGADDYLLKPFAFEELFARIRALTRRSGQSIQKDVIEVRGLILDCTEHTVMLNGEKIHLTPREFQLLELMMRNAGQVLTREIILDRVWGFDNEVNTNTVDAYIKLLRKKLENPGDPPFIQNVRGVGYKLEV
ncbi:response regulator transcription factor [Ammoniphilus resinae]|uniref:DNA-binding response OmpR family regulator n=1 Tax=Ammoniphilus resinae TaxID=861532 RepID=A0ABS4GL87_9BACL|nr:response regulator transcription factor [Ammoniphilus resinae]MBP1931009.1 DNA-binding response OmpR family regulator [Ammoniphilus resinae]